MRKILGHPTSWLALTCMGITNCAGGPGAPQSTPNAQSSNHEVRRSATQGPITVTLTATPADLALGDVLTLRLEILADKSATVLDHAYQRLIEEGDRQFELQATQVDSQVARPTADGRLRWADTYRIAFFVPGEHELPGARVEFTDLLAQPQGQISDAATPAETRMVSTEPLRIVVHQPAEGALSEADLRKIPRLDPVELPRERGAGIWIAVASVVVLASAAFWLVHRLRRGRPVVMTSVSPHEWARRQIAALVAEDLITKGRIQTFYYRLSGIVRGYIERRFEVSAPEMTTEEFLGFAAVDGRFGARREDLQRFLTACDLVKYARHQPAKEQSDAMLRSAEEFIDRTGEEAPGGGSDSSASLVTRTRELS